MYRIEGWADSTRLLPIKTDQFSLFVIRTLRIRSHRKISGGIIIGEGKMVAGLTATSLDPADNLELPNLLDGTWGIVDRPWEHTA